jgi:hypothetical protein
MAQDFDMIAVKSERYGQDRENGVAFPIMLE